MDNTAARILFLWKCVAISNAWFPSLLFECSEDIPLVNGHDDIRAVSGVIGNQQIVCIPQLHGSSMTIDVLVDSSPSFVDGRCFLSSWFIAARGWPRWYFDGEATIVGLLVGVQGDCAPNGCDQHNGTYCGSQPQLLRSGQQPSPHEVQVAQPSSPEQVQQANQKLSAIYQELRNSCLAVGSSSSSGQLASADVTIHLRQLEEVIRCAEKAKRLCKGIVQSHGSQPAERQYWQVGCEVQDCRPV